MPPRKGRHRRRKGPGGPRRTRRAGDVIPIGRARSAGTVHLTGPSITNLVGALLASVRTIVADDESRALGFEVWASTMAATVYGPEQMPAEFYADLADGLVASLDDDARPALAALAVALDHREAEPLRRVHAQQRALLPPGDASDLGIGRAVPRAAYEVADAAGDGVTLLVDVAQPGGDHTAGVHIDHNLGAMATDLVLGPPWAALEASGAHRERGLTVTEVSLADVRARYDEAVAVTDATLDPPTSDDFDTLRPVLERRMALLPPGGRVPEWPTLTDHEVDDLVAGFLASPEVQDLPEPARTEAGWIADLWIRHATDVTFGGPLRLSPALVEVFCASWFPGSVALDPVAAESVEPVLDAWVRHVARATGVDDDRRDEVLAAVHHWAPAAASGPAVPARWPDVDPPHRWRRLEPADHPSAVDADMDLGPPPVREGPDAVRHRAAALARALLGPRFVGPAVELADRLADHGHDRLSRSRASDVWGSAITWLLADDSGAFSPTSRGRTRDDLAADLPVSRQTATRRARELRDLLDLQKGGCAVDW